jgi:transcriptional regulator with XRE-family HTH domain
MAISGALLKEARIRRGFSQRDIGRMLGKSQNYISKLENDAIAGGIKGDELLTFAETLEFDPQAFVGKRSLEDGDKRVNPGETDYRDLIATIENLRRMLPSTQSDRIAERIRADRDLRRIFEAIAFRDGKVKTLVVERLIGWIEGYSEGTGANIVAREE